MKKLLNVIIGSCLIMVQLNAQTDALHKEYMNTTVKPGDDFYEYAVGNWRKNNPIPPSESRWGSFNEVFENNKKIIKNIMDECTKGTFPNGTAKQKIGDYYRSGMDSLNNNKLRTAPLQPYFNQIKALKTKAQLVDLLGTFMSWGHNPCYGFYINQDEKISTKLIPYFSQGGLSLPDRDYYLKDDADKKKIREAYVAHVSKMFVLLGEKQKAADAAAATVLEIETKLADGAMDRVTQRDPYKTYNKMALKDFSALTKNINWTRQTSLFKLPKSDSVIVAQPDFFKKLDETIEKQSLADWKTYLIWRTLNDFSNYLSDDFSEESFNFSGKTLSGTKVRKPRWERVMLNTDANMGELIGQIYVEKAFKPEAKTRMLELVKNLQLTFGDRIQDLDWMGSDTKKAAMTKLNKFMVKIGYPDKWTDYSKMQIKKQSYAANVIAASKWQMETMLSDYKKGVDRTKWFMSPQTVNAYYNPSNNEIVFPAGILQPPFFYPDGDDAVNYGSIGAVIGHEMTHGFDDAGRQYDADGNLKEWWTKEDAERFEKRAEKIVEQFNNYRILDTIPVNGKLTLGENLADLGGVAIAYAAFKRTEQGKRNEMINGMSADERFFISWANCWKNNITPQLAKRFIATDPHAPANLRGFAPLTHHDAFFDAFKVLTSDKLYRAKEERVKIW
jgi:putative endopeptidase